MLSIQSLRYIVQVSAIGSINKAAEILYISQPSLSRTIQEVENQTGIVIFNRTSKGVVPTHEGLVFIEKVKKTLEVFDELQSCYSIYDNSNNNEITLMIGIERHYPAIFASMQFYNKYCRYTDKYVNLILREGNRSELINLICGDVLTLANVHFMSDETESFMAWLESLSLEYRMLSECPVCAQVAADHPLAGELSVTTEMLKPYPRVAFLDEDFTGINYASDLIQYDRQNIQKRIVLQERGTHRDIIVNTQGYSLGAFYEIDSKTDPAIRIPSEIKCIPISDINESFNTVLIFKKGRALNEYEEAYVDMLLEHYGRYFGTREDRLKKANNIEISSGKGY